MNDETRNRGKGPNGDDVARLIRLAGKRPVVPRARAARVREAVHEEWVGLVARRRRHHRRAIGALAAAASIAALVSLAILRPWEPVSPVEPMAIGVVESVAGSPTISEESGEVHVLLGGDSVFAGADVSTDAEARLEMRIGINTRVRLDVGTRLRLLDAMTIALDDGAVYVDSGRHGSAISSLRIVTPFGEVQEIGTQYEVRLRTEGLRVRVREGTVLFDAGAGTRAVGRATEFHLGRDGTTRTGPIAIDGSDWAWLLDVTTVPQLDGMTARAFLEWVAREQGRSLRFDTTELEREAAEITLDGSAQRLTLAQALDAVLPACGMNHTIEGDSLVIGREDTPR